MTERVKRALLSMQRHNWEQGVAAQAFLEAGDEDIAIAMAYEARTRDLHLGKVALYQLSYYRMLGVWGKSAGEETRTLTPKYQILSLARLPFRHARTCKT